MKTKSYLLQNDFIFSDTSPIARIDFINDEVPYLYKELYKEEKKETDIWYSVLRFFISEYFINFLKLILQYF